MCVCVLLHEFLEFISWGFSQRLFLLALGRAVTADVNGRGAMADMPHWVSGVCMYVCVRVLFRCGEEGYGSLGEWCLCACVRCLGVGKRDMPHWVSGVCACVGCLGVGEWGVSCVCTHVYVHVCVCVCLCVLMCVHMSVCYLFACDCINVFVFVSACVYCVCMCGKGRKM